MEYTVYKYIKGFAVLKVFDTTETICIILTYYFNTHNTEQMCPLWGAVLFLYRLLEPFEGFTLITNIFF